MPNSSLTSAQTTHSKRHKDTPISVLNDITNISHSLANTEHGSSSGKSLNPTQDKATVEGNWKLSVTKETLYYILI